MSDLIVKCLSTIFYLGFPIFLIAVGENLTHADAMGIVILSGICIFVTYELWKD